MTIKPPLQTRSERTLQRLADAARGLLDERDFDQISIPQITRRAGVATGTFYTRFANKDALLPFLYERYDREVEHTATELLDSFGVDAPRLDERATKLVDFCVRTYRSQRGIYRAALLHAATGPQPRSGDSHRRKRRAMVRRFANLLAGDGSEVEHPKPIEACEVGLSFVMAACKDRILLDRASAGIVPRLGDRRLTAELTRMLLGYLVGAGHHA